MDYKAKYKEALERAKMSYHTGVYDRDTLEMLEIIFPELKENEDEKIRKELVTFLEELSKLGKDTNFDKWKTSDCANWIAWLEKQGEKESEIKDYNSIDPHFEKPVDFEPEKHCWYVSNVDGKIHDLYYNPNKVEPKFHEGNWITNGDYTWKIVEIKPLDYILQSQDGNIVDDTISHVDEQFHSFTIKDAKDGDVLFDGSNILLVKEVNHWHNVTSYLAYSQVYGIREYFISGSDVITPATKEQCDLLFSKMNEAGYEWDSEKKELKKIENTRPLLSDFFKAEYERGKVDALKYAEWSKKDERILDALITSLNNERFAGRLETLKGVGVSVVIDWLKSLKPQNRWKPSDEQIGVVEAVINNKSFQRRHLNSLYEQLKKLKGE